MEFVVEKISEDLFYINLLIGLPNVLEKFGVKEYTITRNLPATEPEIVQWEHKNGVNLPHDIRDFYASVNGFLFKWFYAVKEKLDEKGENVIKPIVGKIEVNPLENLKQIYGYVTSNETAIIKANKDIVEVKLSLESKVFEICTLAGGKIVLVYSYPKSEPSIWLFTNLMDFHYISKDFRTYLKMSIAHMGIPTWQYLFNSEGISELTKSLFRLISPHLLPENSEQNLPKKKLATMRGKNSVSHLNKIDPTIFKPRTSQISHSRTENFENLSKQNQEKHNQDKKQQFKFQRKPLYYIKKH